MPVLYHRSDDFISLSLFPGEKMGYRPAGTLSRAILCDAGIVQSAMPSHHASGRIGLV
jgi:hypothetical protein